MRKMQFILWVFLALICAGMELAASDAVIRGTVTDNSGKPIRGALVKVSASDKTISRFSQADGRYEITVPSGSYEVSVDAFGFAPRRVAKDTGDTSAVNFSLSPRFNVSSLSGGEIGRLIPDDAAGSLIKGSCQGCHDFALIVRRRGMTAAEWKSFLPNMTAGRRTNPTFTPAKLDALSKALEKYFGPDAKYFGPDAEPPTIAQVEHPALADEALKATIREYSIPTGPDAFAHTIFLDAQSKTAWFSEIGLRANKIGRFDIATEKFQEYSLPAGMQEPHSGVVGKDGTVWMALAHRGTTKLVSLDPATGKMRGYDFADDLGAGHTLGIDHQGNLWESGAGLWFFDVHTDQFKAFKFAVPDTPPPGSTAAMEAVPGDPERVGAGTYHTAVDSKGTVWASSASVGMIVALQPSTGETREYFAPDTPGIRGIMVDSRDNVWFADFWHHRLGKLDPKTGVFKMYQPPTLGAAPYGLVEDKHGYIWFADMSGNNITRFDPKSEKFVEYPIPTLPSYARFIGAASDGRIWFTEYWTGKIGVLDPGDTSTQMAQR